MDGRGIYYKHADAKFYQAGAFLLGRQISQLPLVSNSLALALNSASQIPTKNFLCNMTQLAMEIVAFGLPFYFISGLAYEPTAFFVYLAILIGELKQSVYCTNLLYYCQAVNTFNAILPQNPVHLMPFRPHLQIISSCHSIQICLENAIWSSCSSSAKEGECTRNRHIPIPPLNSHKWIYCLS